MGMTSLYRHFDADENLLYVGVSKRHITRLAQHHKKSGWYWDIAKVTVENFDSRERALYAEALAIRDECPQHNVTCPTPVDPDAPIEPPKKVAEVNLSPDMCRGARFLLNWSRSDLAEKAGVSTPVVVKYERGGNLREETLAKLVEAFSAHGVTFPNGRGVERIERRHQPPATH